MMLCNIGRSIVTSVLFRVQCTKKILFILHDNKLELILLTFLKLYSCTLSVLMFLSDDKIVFGATVLILFALCDNGGKSFLRIYKCMSFPLSLNISSLSFLVGYVFPFVSLLSSVIYIQCDL